MENAARTKVAAVLVLSVYVFTFACRQGHAYGEKQVWKITTPPDFTKGGEPVGREEQILGWKHWTMGPTGASVWIWAHPMTICSDGATQIYVIKVDPETPAHGKLQAHDVILGAAGRNEVKPFVRNARREIAAAITQAETEENRGKLELMVWRKGKTFSTTLQLPVMGSFSKTLSEECEKTQRIIDRAAIAITRRGLDEEQGLYKASIPNCLDALGLLATGDKQYLPLLREFARTIGSPDVAISHHTAPGCWRMAYIMIYLAEYHLATEDDHVLPALEQYANVVARGRSGLGTWGHGLTDLSHNEGKPFGPASGYGAMNATGIPLTIGLVLAQKCGVRNRDIDAAVNMSATFLRYFAKKGGIPYGDHPPFMRYYSNNGKNAEAAVLFDLLGDAETASFFTAMTLASTREREQGHTGPYFSMAWGALGAGCGGPEATATFMKEMRWYYELQRRAGSDFRYQPVLMGGEEHGKYGKGEKWSCAGVALLHYCLPRKTIYLTGKGGRAAPPLTVNEIRACIDVAPRYIYEDCTTEQLLELLEHRLPVTRLRVAAELATRHDNVVPRLIAMLGSDNRYARYGACDGLRYAGRNSTQAADALAARLRDSDDWNFRYFAALAFGRPKESALGFGSAAERAVPTLLKLASTHDPVKDPHRKLQATIAMVLFSKGGHGVRGVFHDNVGLETADRRLLMPAIRSILTNPNGGGRSMAGQIYPQLTEEDLEQLWGDIYTATRSFAPSGVMFGVNIQDAGLKILSEHRFIEGMELAAFHLMRDRHSKIRRIPFFLDTMKRYGAAAHPLAAQLKPKRFAAIAKWSGMSRDRKKEYLDLLEKKFQEIEANKAMTEHRSMKQYLDAVAAGTLVGCQHAPVRSGPRESSTPNIIIIMTDDMGYADVSCYPHSEEVHTPNIDSICDAGVRFTDGYVSCAQCAPTRAGLLSGKYQQRYGFYHNRDVFDAQFLHQITLPQVLKQSGYTTGMVGKWHLGRGSEKEYPHKRGFDEFYGFLQGMRGYLKPQPNSPIMRNGKIVEEEFGYLTDFLNREATAFVNKYSAKGPFFLYVAYNAPHYPLEAKEELLKKFNTGDPSRDKQLAMMASVDEGVGQLLDALKHHGVYDNTLIFFLSDNGGEPKRGADSGTLREGKNSAYEGGPRVPFIVSWPARIRAGQVCSDPVISLDIFATSVAAAGGTMPRSTVFDSENMLPTLFEETTQPLHDVLFWQQREDRWAVRRGNWKLVAKAMSRKAPEKKTFELYDLGKDTGEDHDLAAKHPKTVEELHSLFRAWKAQMQ